MKLYQRILTCTKVYGWGSNDKGSLGGSILEPQPVPIRGLHRPVRLGRLHPRSVVWPEETNMDNIGIVADLQCGGWSTTVLNSKGALFTRGVLDGLPYNAPDSPVVKRLNFPPGFSLPTQYSPNERYDPYTAIKQFSSGRSHVLGLSDTGRIWSWNSADRPGLHVKFLGVDLVETSASPSGLSTGRVTKVVAGWNMSSAYVKGHGIVVWASDSNSEFHGGSDTSSIDGMLVLEHWTVPHSGYLNPQSNLPHDAADIAYGQVESWAVLDHHILFATDLGKLFGVRLPSDDNQVIGNTFRISSSQITIDDPPADLLEISSPLVADVQGAFTNFAIFTRAGAVLIGTDALLDALDAQTSPSSTTPRASLPQLRQIPALQNSGVLALAFGDHHFHALHASGAVSSYGTDSMFCGSLGLGGGVVGQARGVRGRTHWGGDGHLLPECATTGRRVGFEVEKRAWIDWVSTRNSESTSRLDSRMEEAQPRMQACFARADVGAEVSEWFEQRLRRWEDGPPAVHQVEPVASDPARSKGGNTADNEADNENNDAADSTSTTPDAPLPAYFALSIAAGGWHSGALVLVDETKAECVRNLYRVAPAHLEHEAKAEVTPSSASEQQTLLGNGQDGNNSEAAGQGLLNYVSSTVRQGARWFLGLDEARRNPGGADGRGESVAGGERWVWEARGEAFPRLRLRSGEVLPGSVDVAGWPEGGGCPAWRSVEYVDV